jgi:hypothetical protein
MNRQLFFSQTPPSAWNGSSSTPHRRLFCPVGSSCSFKTNHVAQGTYRNSGINSELLGSCDLVELRSSEAMIVLGGFIQRKQTHELLISSTNEHSSSSEAGKSPSSATPVSGDYRYSLDALTPSENQDTTTTLPAHVIEIVIPPPFQRYVIGSWQGWRNLLARRGSPSDPAPFAGEK